MNNPEYGKWVCLDLMLAWQSLSMQSHHLSQTEPSPPSVTSCPLLAQKLLRRETTPMCYTHFCEDWSELISTWKKANDALLPVFSVNFAYTSSSHSSVPKADTERFINSLSQHNQKICPEEVQESRLCVVFFTDLNKHGHKHPVLLQTQIYACTHTHTTGRCAGLISLCCEQT